MNAFKQDERGQMPTVTADAMNARSSLYIAWLNSLASPWSISVCNYQGKLNFAHHEASLVEIIDIAIRDAIFGFGVLHESKSRVYRVRIFG